MVEIYKNIYLVEIPLKGNPLKSLNCFIIKSNEQNLIVDTGFNTKESKDLLMGALKKLNIDLNKTLLFLTHLHSDHTGLASFLEENKVKVYISKIDGKLLNSSLDKDGVYWAGVVKGAVLQGLEKDNLNLEEHPGYKYRPSKKLKYISAEEGDSFNIGEYNFKVINLQGHTPGLMGLYEENHKILFCGDHILGEITPNITYWGEGYGDSLGKYMESLDKVYNMDVLHLFSSHRLLVKNHRERIAEIKKHHEKRLHEASNVLLKYGSSTVRTVTKNLHWDIRSKDWNDFPNSQKWFAAGEAQAHLERLRELGEVKSELINGIIYYRLI
ncbi:MAG: MBL fold metallo-hydrolase [Tissierellia bacterium]|nr:MBL fold metallo-hydrolase [Tissierellia bacterium]